MPKPKILIIDDDPDIQRGLNLRLRASGYDTVFASDAVGAVGEARGAQPSAIILDLGLPGGDGFVVMDRLRNLASVASVPIIVLTARDAHGNSARARAAGAKAFLTKPFDDEELLSALESVLTGRNPDGPCHEANLAAKRIVLPAD